MRDQEAQAVTAPRIGAPPERSLRGCSARDVEIKAADHPESQNEKDRDQHAKSLEDHVAEAHPAAQSARLDRILSVGRFSAFPAPHALRRKYDVCAYRCHRVSSQKPAAAVISTAQGINTSDRRRRCRRCSWNEIGRPLIVSMMPPPRRVREYPIIARALI